MVRLEKKILTVMTQNQLKDKQMIKPILELFFALGFFIWGRWYADINLQPELYGMCIGFSAALLIDICVFLFKERAFLLLYLNSLILKRNKELRLTIAYLYKIEMNGKYLLVKSNRIANTYQPVGGVYKYFNPEAKKDLDRIGALTDNNITNDHISEFDLRLKLIKRKNIRKFLKWFFSAEEREWDPWREFYEEMVVSGILPASDFGYIHYELVGQHFDPIHYDKFFKVDTFKYVDIFTPKYVSHKQQVEIKKLMETQSDKYIWVTKEEIDKGKSDNHHLIADHTHKIFHTNKIK